MHVTAQMFVLGSMIIFRLMAAPSRACTIYNKSVACCGNIKLIRISWERFWFIDLNGFVAYVTARSPCCLERMSLERSQHSALKPATGLKQHLKE